METPIDHPPQTTSQALADLFRFHISGMEKRVQQLTEELAVLDADRANKLETLDFAKEEIALYRHGLTAIGEPIEPTD